MESKWLTVDTKHLYGFDEAIFIQKYQKKVNQIHQQFLNQQLPDGHMNGWYSQPDQDHKGLLKQINTIAKQFNALKVTDIVYLGIGGSYTGIRAILDFLKPEQKANIKVHFVPDISAFNIAAVARAIKGKSWALVVTSKSGRTLEPAVTFRYFRNLLHKQYKQKHALRTVVITDAVKGLLVGMSNQYGYAHLTIPSNIGGRFSTLSPAGLLLAKLCGHDPKQLLLGTLTAKQELANSDLNTNSAYYYAALRHWLYTTKKLKIEVTVAYHSAYEYLLLQHRQLFDESEGKGGKSLFPTFSLFTTDLHSMGQLYQEGEKNFFETVIQVQTQFHDLELPPSDFNNDDQLDYLLAKSMNEISNTALEAVVEAHFQSNVNIIKLTLKERTTFMFGYFYFWLSMATMMSGSLLGHNVFDQPGVEVYKQLMFAKLGRE